MSAHISDMNENVPDCPYCLFRVDAPPLAGCADPLHRVTWDTVSWRGSARPKCPTRNGVTQHWFVLGEKFCECGEERAPIDVEFL